jgi:N-acyl-D-aspartate/D-glutamate deacylase
MSESDQHARSDLDPAAPRFSLDAGSPWDRAAAWQELRGLYNGKKITAIRDATFRARLIGEADSVAPTADLTQLFPVSIDDTDGVDDRSIPSDPSQSLAAEAVRRGISPAAAFLEMVLETGGRQAFSYPWIRHEGPPSG